MAKEKNKKAAVVTKVEDLKKEPSYSLELQLNGLVLKAEADSLIEAIEKLAPDFPVTIKTKVVIRYSKGGVERFRVLPALRANLLFNQLELNPSKAKFLADKLTHELAA